MADPLNIDTLRTLVGGWAQSEIDAGASPQAWDAGARARVVKAIEAFGYTPDAEQERQAAMVWDQTWLEALAADIRAVKQRRDPMWPPGHSVWDKHEASLKAVIDNYDEFKKRVPQRW